MDLFDAVKACARRWYVVLPLLAIVGWYTHTVYESVKPVYYSNAVISLAPPNFRVDQNLDGSPVPRNGLLDVGGAPLIANMVALGLSDPKVLAQVAIAGGQPNYTAKMFPAGPNMPDLPLVMIEATELTQADATVTVTLAAAQAAPVLQSIQQQAGVPDDQMVKAFIVSPPTPPAAGIPSRTRTTVALLVAGAGLSLLAGLVVDVLVMRWSARRRNRQSPGEQANPRPPAPTEATVPPEPAHPPRTQNFTQRGNGHERVPADESHEPTTKQRSPDYWWTESQ